jgi:4-methyl-5(b-hydroxyethyl)-thiazole monophosphate biosynthesis
MGKAVMLLADGFEEIEAVTVVDVLRRLDIVCDLCSIAAIDVRGAHRIVVRADFLFDEVNFKDYQTVILPGGMPGAKNLKADKRVIALIQEFDAAKKWVTAICAAPIVLKEAKITAGRTLTSYPGFQDELSESHYVEDRVVQDGNLITSRGPATALDFAFRIAQMMTDTDRVRTVRSGMLME